MNYNGVYLNFNVCVAKDGNDYFYDMKQFNDLCDELNDEEIGCIIECLDQMLNNCVNYEWERTKENIENRVSKIV